MPFFVRSKLITRCLPAALTEGVGFLEEACRSDAEDNAAVGSLLDCGLQFINIEGGKNDNGRVVLILNILIVL